jgi:transmembrane sensor
MNKQEASELLKKWEAGQCTPDELVLLETWFENLDQDAPGSFSEMDYKLIQERLWNRIDEHQPGLRIHKFNLRTYRNVAAAITFFIMCAGGYLLFQDQKHRTSFALHQVKDVPAITNKATLTLANGQQIILDDAGSGMIANQSGVTINKNKNGQIVYAIVPLAPLGRDAAGREGQASYNIISTPNGGQYQVVLPDGSHVWLNAASSLKYPVAFNAKERKVELTGEGYFEITKNSRQPFIVSSSNQSIRVLGTHFNVSAYAGELTTTTLAEGSVLVSLSDSNPVPTGSPSKTLKPGDQSTATANGLTVSKVNPEDIIAWKDGLFVFSNTDLKDVMKQIARCYNVEVDYASIPNVKYDGEISRSTTLLKVLQFIEAGSDVPLKLEGRRIMRK